MSFRGREATVGIRTLRSSCFPENLDKIGTFLERIATPVCELARNDRFFNNLRQKEYFLLPVFFQSAHQNSLNHLRYRISESDEKTAE